MLTLRDLFQVVFEMKKKEVEEAKKTRKVQEAASQQEGHYDVSDSLCLSLSVSPQASCLTLVFLYSCKVQNVGFGLLGEG